jgi:glycosyltransferase involved in cell wall biosynthesis
MAIMPCFQVIVLTTHEETFGLVMAEAMRCGVAVIGSRAGGVKEIIDEGISGLMFESGNLVELADALQSLYTDVAKREKLAREGKAKADRMFDQDMHFIQLMQLITKA